RGDLKKIRVVYGGFDMDRFKPTDATAQRKAWDLEPEDYAFGVVGGYSLPRGKGQPEFLRAAAKIRASRPQARFLVIGRGNMKDMLEQQIGGLGLTGSAWLTPYCSDMAAGMNAIDCLVLPQVGTEAIPGVVCEAHACGKPVIASNLDGIPEAFSVGGYGELVRRGSVDELAVAMADFCQRPGLSEPERWKLHEKVGERFSLEKAARDLSELYAAL
ncbi:MAG TPA: glycosyltransferase, partial [Candidatus Dormibacteraeota bacterium]|nr:glycosyltransferase [Candidatus Dormibacteraeota bacterium]